MLTVTDVGRTDARRASPLWSGLGSCVESDKVPEKMRAHGTRCPDLSSTPRAAVLDERRTQGERQRHHVCVRLTSQQTPFLIFLFFSRYQEFKTRFLLGHARILLCAKASG